MGSVVETGNDASSGIDTGAGKFGQEKCNVQVFVRDFDLYGWNQEPWQ